MMMLRIMSLGILLLSSLLAGSNLHAGDVPPQPAMGSSDAAPERTPSAGSPSGEDLESAPLEAAGAGRVLEMNYAADRLSVKAEKADLRALLKKISEVAGIEVEMDPDIAGTVSVSFSDLSLEDAINRLLEAADSKNYLATFDKDSDVKAGGYSLRKIVVGRKSVGSQLAATAKNDTRPAIELLCLNTEEQEDLSRELAAILSSLSRQDEKKLLKDLEKILELAYMDLCGDVVRKAVPVIMGLLKEYPDPGTEYVKQYKKLDDQRTDEYFPPTRNTKARVAMLRLLGIIGDQSVVEYLERIKNTSPQVVGWGELSQTGEGGAAEGTILRIRGKQRFLDDASRDSTEDIIQKLIFDMKYQLHQIHSSSMPKEYTRAQVAARVYPLTPSYKVRAFATIGQSAVAPLLQLYEESVRLKEDGEKSGTNTPYETGNVMYWSLESLGALGDPSVLPILEKYQALPGSDYGRYGSNLGKTIEILKSKGE